MATTRKKPSKGAKPHRKLTMHSSQAKTDDSIMGTNDSSIVSKRSVSKLYLPSDPDFYEPFVQKFVRRNPLINRGYWLRMHAIEQVVKRFLQEPSGKSKVVVNLGCGYDPLPFQFWHRHPSLSKDATFVDVDYPQLIGRKRDRILTNNVLRDALIETNLRPAALPVFLRSNRYLALGCDLRELELLEKLLKAEFDDATCSILFVAEVSLTYMPQTDSDALIQWAGTLQDARFCLLEQYLPQGSDHPFAQTMLKHFEKLQTPIHAVKTYPLLRQQGVRFLEAGWSSLPLARNLWDLWSDNDFTPPELRHHLDTVEPFDEWEEFALFAGHYFLLVASTHKTALPGAVNPQTPEEESTDAENALAPSIVITRHPSAAGTSLQPRRFGAAFALDPDCIAYNGGQGPQQRLESTDLLSRGDARACIQPGPSPQARICHSITSLNSSEALLVGGRKSPSQALADCWLMSNNSGWQPVQDLAPARFRHCSVQVTVPISASETVGVLVFGGKSSSGAVLDDWCLWTPNHGWQKISQDGPRPAGRFGATICTIRDEKSRGLLVGGMDAYGTVVADYVWEWQVAATPDLRLHFTDRTRDVNAVPAEVSYSRMGAQLLHFGNQLLLLGGVAGKDIGDLASNSLLISPGTTINIQRPDVSVSDASWPLLVGTGAVAVSDGEIIVAGGGAVCFSMGSFWNQDHYSITREDAIPQPRSCRVSQLETVREGHTLKPTPRLNGTGRAARTTPHDPKTRPVPRIRVESTDTFAELIAASKPAIIEGLDIGPCTGLWSLEYLKNKIGSDREIVVHECESDRMTFKDKNFQYVKKTTGDFLDGIAQGAKTYLRAVSSTQPNKHPTKLEEDFPTIAPDFKLPDMLSSIHDTYHSSPLRISGPVSLWLHYDVLANVLCQVKGTKTLRLYPPSDAKYLDFPPGGSSSNTNVLTSRDPKLRRTHPHIAALKPGDVLFLPPMWAHTATPEDGWSVAVNVFFRNLNAGYAAGKDVYGNRDLQAYENGRRDVERVVKAFKGVPDDMAQFYMDRLAAELQETAEKRGRQGR
ncbi:leucine carboxyl methyltransferase 2 [Amniculicola lignicola CBS 123094]|uniref:tRNA wybutosine-synthesizing protein 4 n=1 Tax=Amniculicola lignicola CBS 123094 TaxID=1392246 RepID=A0A6A5VZ67_9PLEO|nr:leucine carboxyl methyltransferase 2 [Amniculicola lignicola CBS 123094]